jgi:hypothetical protein
VHNTTSQLIVLNSILTLPSLSHYICCALQPPSIDLLWLCHLSVCLPACLSASILTDRDVKVALPTMCPVHNTTSQLIAYWRCLHFPTISVVRCNLYWLALIVSPVCLSAYLPACLCLSAFVSVCLYPDWQRGAWKWQFQPCAQCTKSQLIVIAYWHCLHFPTTSIDSLWLCHLSACLHTCLSVCLFVCLSVFILNDRGLRVAVATNVPSAQAAS